MKINLDAIKARVSKKVIMSAIVLLVIILAMIIFIGVVRSCVQSKHSNMIDLDMLEPDGTINQRKIFQESIREDIERNMRYQRKDAF